MIFLIALALSPLVQTGLSYWVSCGTLLSLMIVYAARRNIAVALRPHRRLHPAGLHGHVPQRPDLDDQ